jgi:hypothetical protein
MEKNNVKIESQATSKETPSPKKKGGMKTKSVRYSDGTLVWGS